ncbi:YqcC family protein [Shewanella gelidimarina]|uniref:YqcC family protein n=1 Tax=Shewanella gelidimarina TaxID=56813 RepID=UPI00200CF2EF|nr:YqcC family protein [Shewanella gelidimarina]MCL1057660.1 YqcC family protein [Shewanella gelidimarina]
MLTHLTRHQLIKLQDELVSAALWSATLPSESAMQSSAPFACDTMAFEQWLQFILIPKMHYLLDSAMPLPKAIAVAPMAEHVWAGKPEFCRIIKTITELDELLSETN